MGSIEPNMGMAIFIVLAVLVGVVSTILRTVHTFRQSPPIGENHASLRAEVTAIKESLLKKQDTGICMAMHHQMDDVLRDVRSRHASHEEKISRQVSDTHKRIDRQTAAISANGATLETFMDEVRGWKETTDRRK